MPTLPPDDHRPSARAISDSTKHWIQVWLFIAAVAVVIFSLASMWSSERYQRVEKERDGLKQTNAALLAESATARQQLGDVAAQLEQAKRDLQTPRQAPSIEPHSNDASELESLRVQLQAAREDARKYQKEADEARRSPANDAQLAKLRADLKAAQEELQRFKVLPAEAQIEEARRSREYWERLAGDPEIQRMYQPFLGKGNWNCNGEALAEKQGMPFACVQEVMRNAELFQMVMCREVHGANNDRGGWHPPPAHGDLKAAAEMKRLHEQFRDLAPRWVDMGLLPK